MPRTALKKTPDVTLYHYTTQNGFLGIIDSRTLWAGNVYFMNDAAEMKHAAGVAIDRVNVLARKSPDISLLAEAIVHELIRLEEFPVFCVSFSESRDLLSQWRAYANESGIALAFNPDELTEIAKINKLKLYQCAYSDSDQFAIADDKISQAIDAFRGRIADGYNPQGSATPTAKQFVEDFPTWGALIKHPAFAEEKEWRMISGTQDYTHPNMKFRAGSTCILPYLEAKLDLGKANDGRDRFGFHDVLLGPTAAKDLQWKAVMHLLVSKNIYFHQITPSGSPYRRL